MREALNLEIEDDIDIIMLNEIWLHDVEELPYIPGFKLSYGAARPITARATGYGGAAIYIKQENFGKIDVWRVRESDGVIWIKCQKSERAPVQFFCCCYAAPDNTPGCPQNIDDWFEELENEISIARGLGEVLVAGDFNAHIGTEPDFDRLCAAGTDRGSGVDRLIMEEDMVHACCPRTSVDASVNSRGKKLLQLCDFTGLYVVNGRVAGDIPAAATCLTNSKSKEPTSVIDLFLACPKVFIKTESLKVGGKLAQGADHLAVTVTINEFMSMSELMEGEYEADDVELSISNSTPSFNIGDEFIIDPKLLPAFKAELQAAAPLLEQICVAANDTAESKNANMLNTAEADLRKVLSNACVAAGMKIKGAAPDKDRWARKMNKLPPALKLQQKQARSTHRRAVRECDVEAIVTNRNNVKRSHRNIRKARRSLGAKRLERLLKFDPKEFYQKYRRPPSPTLVSQSDLSNHFEQLLGAEPPDLPVPPIVPGTVPPPESIEGLLQTPFSMEEMLAALKKVRNGAAMLGILKPQLLKSAIAEIGPTLLELLNASVAVGKLPTAWALSAITAIPKAGSDTRTCDGYRGIAVGTLAAKLHGSMLDIRTSCWAEASELRAEGQFGFRRGKGTASASFILRALTDRVKAQKGGRLYTCFVDFKKAYDSVPRHLLWAKLERRGVTGWVLNAIKAMYADVPMCVKSSTGLGRTFQSKLGVKQGCPLSPLLFGLYLDDWDDELRAAAGANNSESTEFDFPTLNNMPLRSLMYADDLVQAATSMPGLRKQMALLEDFSARWGLTVNASKTKLMLFSGIRSIKEEKAAVLYVDGETVEVVEQFKYLGTIFHCSNALSRYAVPARALSGRKAYHATRRRLEELELKGVDTNFRLFDVMVEPVLGYGAEVWAPELLCQDPLKNSCERVHLQALKWLFGVRKSAASCIVLAEAGRWPLALRWVKRLTRFYNGLVKAPSNSILKNAFIDNCQLKANPLPGSIPSVAQRCWAAQLQRAFSLFGVVISLEEPCELHVNQVCRRWKQWYLSKIQNVDESRTKIYKYVQQVRNGLPEKEYCAAACLTIPGFRSRQRLLQLRMGSHWLKEETGRWTHIKREERECKQCAGKEMNTVETVEHMVFKCPNYDDIRADFSCLDFSNNNLNEFLEQQQTQLGSFVKKFSVSSEKVVVTEGTPAVVYKAGGAHYWELLTEAQKYLSKPVELPNIYVVTKANVLPFGKDLPLSKVSETIPTAATKARIKGTITDTNSKIQDYLVDNVVGYHQLDLPCVVLATHEVNEALLAAAKEAGSQDLKMPSEEKYYLLFASVDLCQLRLLTLEGASVLGHANEAIADSTLSVPITSPATKRAHWKLLGTEILNLPKQLKSKVGSNYKKIKRRIPPANMFSTFLRYSRNPKDYKNGTQVGGRTVNGEPVKQQTACSSAIASREVHNVIMQAMKPITLLQRDFLAANNPTTTSVVVNWMNMNAKAITTGGWGVLPHLDGMDSGGVAYIIQYGLGDLRELHGGHMCLPQLHLICPVGACTVHFLRTGSLLHNSLPHVASEKARVVGTSLHVNKSFLIMSNAQSRMQGLDGEGYVQYAQESCIDSETLKDCTEMKKLLKFGNWRV